MNKRKMVFVSIFMVSMLMVHQRIQTDSIFPKDITNELSAKLSPLSFHHALQESIIFFDDFESGSPGWTTHDLTDMGVMWHPDNFNAFSGNSWWCGQPEIKGYYDVWYQKMITPEIDLSSASSPVTLSFKHYFQTEGDGVQFWDGGNVRISNDGGASFELIHPSVGSYSTDCMHAWNLYHPDFQPDTSHCLPSYSGDSGGWIDAEFDLSAFVGQHIKVAFVFASDDYLSTVYLMGSYDELKGWFIDDVMVTDAQHTLFFDDAGDTQPAQMTFWVYPPSGDWWTETTEQPYSPSHCWVCTDHSRLNNVLESPWIELPQENIPNISFYYKADFPCDNPWPDWWNVWITTDSIHWEVFMERTNDSNESWEEYVFSLYDFLGERIKFRWEMFGGAVPCPSHIFIDDVKVYTTSSSLTVENTDNSGYGSLRNAINSANSTIGPNTIVFNIPETDPNYDSIRGVWTIKPNTPLPILTDTSTTIDGTTQTQNQGDRNPFGPEIEIDGSNIGEGTNSYGGFTIFSAKNTIKGLIINQFPWWGILLNYNNAFGNCIIGNYIGTDETGEDSLGNAMGIGLYLGAANNTIGGINEEERNIISGNKGGSGIVIQGSGACGNKVIGNYIGMGVSGASSVGNTLRGVIVSHGASGNIIGGTSLGERNIISGNRRAGVYIADADSNFVLGNFIGTDVSGAIGMGNGSGPLWTDDGGRLYYNSGVVIDNSSGNVIGDSTAGGWNLISGNYYNGIYITKSGSRNNTILGNLVGTDVSGNADLGNELAGVRIDTSAQDNSIISGNTISFNGTDGVYIQGASTRGNIVNDNTMTDNTRDGIRVENVNDGSTELTSNIIKRNFIGIHIIDGVGLPTIDGNVIEDNTEAGILIEDGGSISSKVVADHTETIENNFISLNAKGIHIRPWSSSRKTQNQITLDISHNNIFLNTEYGLINEDPAITVVANDNWWGDASGPYNEDTNPNGQGNAIVGNVVCNNWLSDLLGVSISSLADVGAVPGSDASIDFRVYNVSSSTHTFDMTASDSLGWSVMPAAFSLTLGSITDTIVTIVVSVPQEVEVGTKNSIVLSAVSRDDPDVYGSDEAIIRVMLGIRGDANADATVNILDVIRVVNIILGTGDPPTEFENWASDCSGDEKVNIIDVIGIVNVILGIGECEP